ncbi:MAG: hypothetical protein WKF37_16035 [Bryobacteraceae bacterium]
MAALVVDASVALAWALPDEISAYADAALAVVETEGLRVPGAVAARSRQRTCHGLLAQTPDP